MPREHGAYAELLFPLAAALLEGGASTGSLAFAGAALLLFLLHEPAAVVAGLRGERLRRDLGARARSRALLLACVAVACGIVAAVVSPGRALLAALVPGGFALLVLPVATSRRLKTVPAELAVAGALATTVLPVGLAGGMDLREAVVDAGVWLGSFSAATFAVHAVKARRRPDAPGRWTVVATPFVVAAVVGGAGLAAASGAASWVEASATLPPAAVAMGAWALSPHPRHLRRLGWSMVAANVAVLALLLHGGPAP